jgi:predicted component of viral defense system (DUF524 family)
MTGAVFELLDGETGALRGTLRLATLPSAREILGLAALVERGGDGLERVQLVEGCEYAYEIDAAARIVVDKPEMFVADDDTGRRGRLRTQLFTGRVEVQLWLDGRRSRPVAFEVRSTKLGYLDDYRWMLEDIAELGTGLLLERFAPSEQRLAIDAAADADTMYQRFVFLRGLLAGERLTAALRRVTAEPYVQWQRTDEPVAPGRGMRGSERLTRDLVKPGPRMSWPAAPCAALRTVPQRISDARSEETLDNVPNRFVRFALEEWRGLVASMLEALDAERRRAPAMSERARRGLREGGELADAIDELIRSPMFGEVGRLTSFPIGNQVLQKKDGYRDVLQTYLVVQLGARLAWAGGEDVFSGGQRNVATLYEYWVYLEIAKIVSELCDQPLDLQALVAGAGDGMRLVLRRERASSIRGGFSRRGRRFSVELCFNQQFAPGPSGTWTKSLRPDCSLHIVPLDPRRGDDDVWLHFDAKYRMDRIDGLLGDDGEPALLARSDDLYKMHTYRDAIIRAVGAYIVFPGTERLAREQYGEVLPGLGAFPLRPSRAGAAAGADDLRSFLHRAFEHVATQTTKHERARYWRRVATTGPDARDRNASARDAVEFLRAPPADTPVLLGYVKSPEHHAWIQTHGLYNLRADPERHGAVGLRGPELSAELVILYGASGELGDGPTLFRATDEPRVLMAEELQALGYPDPRGRVYFCLQLEPIPTVPPWWPTVDAGALAQRHRGHRPPAAPIVVSWRTVVEEPD